MNMFDDDQVTFTDIVIVWTIFIVCIAGLFYGFGIALGYISK